MRGAAHLLAHPHAAPAEDADVVVAVEKRIVMFRFVAVVIDRIGDLGQPDLFHDVLQFALTVVRAVAAAGAHPGLADGELVLLALLGSPADQTARGMLTQDELQDFLAHVPQGRGVGQDLHALLGYRAAGQRIAAHAFDLHHAHAAAAERAQVLVRAERGDVDVVQFRGPQHADALRERHGAVVYFHVQGTDVFFSLSRYASRFNDNGIACYGVKTADLVTGAALDAFGLIEIMDFGTGPGDGAGRADLDAALAAGTLLLDRSGRRPDRGTRRPDSVC